MIASRRPLEEIALSFLLKQITKNQITFLVSLNVYHREQNKSYLDKHVYPLLFQNLKWLKERALISEEELKALKSRCDYSSFVFKPFLEKNRKDFTLEDFIGFCRSIVDSYDFSKKEHEEVLPKLRSTMKIQDEAYCSAFHEELYQKISSSDRKILLESFKNLLQFMYNNSLSYGCPNIFHFIEADCKDEKEKDSMEIRHMIIRLNIDDDKETTETRSMLLSMTVYSFLMQLVIDFNINIDFYDFFDGDKVLKVETTDYGKPLSELLNKSTELTLKPKLNGLVLVQETYWQEANKNQLLPNIQLLYDQWANRQESISLNLVFANFNSPKLTETLKLIFKDSQNDSLSKEKFLEKIKELEDTLCILHLIIGFKVKDGKNLSPYLRNVQPEDLPFFYQEYKDKPPLDFAHEMLFKEKDPTFKLKTLLFYCSHIKSFDHIFIPDDLPSTIDKLIKAEYQALIEDSFLRFKVNPKNDEILLSIYLFYLNQSHSLDAPPAFANLEKGLTSNMIINQKSAFHLYCLLIQKGKQFGLEHMQKIFLSNLLLEEDIKSLAFEIFKQCNDNIKGDLFNKLFELITQDYTPDRKEDKSNMNYLFTYIEVINNIKALAINQSDGFRALRVFIIDEINSVLQSTSLDFNSKEEESTLSLNRIHHFLLFSSLYYPNQISFESITVQGFYSKLKQLLSRLQKDCHPDLIGELQFSIYLFIMTMGYEIEEFQLMKISTMPLKAYYLFNFFLQFYLCTPVRTEVLSNQSDDFSQCFHYHLFNQLFYYHAFSFEKLFEFCAGISVSYDAIINALTLIDGIWSGFISVLPSLSSKTNLTFSSGEFIVEHFSPVLAQEEVSRSKLLTSLDEKLADYQFKSALVIINKDIPLAASYACIDEEYYRFHTKWQSISKGCFKKVINNQENEVFLFYEKKSEGKDNKANCLNIAPLLMYPTVEKIFTRELIKKYPYHFFELSLRSKALFCLLYKDQSLCLSQMDMIRQFHSKINNENSQDLFERYKRRIKSINWIEFKEEVFKLPPINLNYLK